MIPIFQTSRHSDPSQIETEILSSSVQRINGQSHTLLCLFSLLSHYARVSICEILVQLVERLHPDVMAVLLDILDKFAWENTVKNVAAMNFTYFYHSRNNRDGTVSVPYVDDGVSFLKFSNNFFKHNKVRFMLNLFPLFMHAVSLVYIFMTPDQHTN